MAYTRFFHGKSLFCPLRLMTGSFPRSGHVPVLGAVVVAVGVAMVCLVGVGGREYVVSPMTAGHGRFLEDVVTKLHKDLFPLDSSDIWGTVFVTVGLMIAASGGIGGGGMLVPLLILVYGFHPKNAIALSNFTIVGSSITNIVMNLSKRHPNVDRPLIDWDLILVMEPLTMAGAIVGAFASKLLPDWLLTIMLVILLAFTTWTTLEKGLSQWHKETVAFEAEGKSTLWKADNAELELVAMAEATPLLASEDDAESLASTFLTTAPSTSYGGGRSSSSSISSSNSSGSGSGSGSGSSTEKGTSSGRTPDEDQELLALLESERHTPIDKAVILTAMVVAVVVLNMLKGGGKAFPSPLGIPCGGASYWGIQALVLVVVLGVSVHMRSVLIEKWKLKRRLHYAYAVGDVEWNERNTIIYPCICFFAGVFAGMFGVGGGIVKGPLMLQMGVHPLVASNTVAVMIMFTSVAGTAMYIAFGTLVLDYGWFLFVVGLLATCVGQFGVSYLVEKYRRVSLVSLSIGAVVAISTLLMGLQSIFAIIDFDEHPEPASSVCGE